MYDGIDTAAYLTAHVTCTVGKIIDYIQYALRYMEVVYFSFRVTLGQPWHRRGVREVILKDMK